jgi:DNA polymerase epsilon subunit 3
MATEDKSSSKTPEFEPPQACVSRIIKNVLPDNVQITKDARAAFTRAAGIFIFYLTHCANDFSKENKRQTIYTQDVLQALKELDFGEFEPVLEEFLARK